MGLNLDIPETGIVNIVVLIAGLLYLLSPLLSESMASREKEIQSDIDDAIAKYNEATARLAEAEKAKAQADSVVKEINDSIAKDVAQYEESLKRSAQEKMKRQEDAAAVKLANMEADAVAVVERHITDKANERAFKQLAQLDSAKQKKFLDATIAAM